MDENNIAIAAIQESKLTSSSKDINTNNYTLVRKDRGTNKGGGLAFLVHNSIPFHEEPTPNTLINDPHLETLTISIESGDKNCNNLQVRNIYIPPVSSCQQQYSPPIQEIFTDLNNTSLILGDINAHHPNWFSEGNEDARGRDFADIINDKPFGIINEDTPTRIAANSRSSPDISLVSNSLLATSEWKAETKLSSDHLPITINLKATIKKIKSQDKQYINFEKANWESFYKFTEEKFADAYHTNNVHKDERFFRNIIQKAAKQFIPSGRIMKVVNEIPTAATNLMDERDQLRHNNPANPRIQELNREINIKINEHKQNKWKEHLDKCKANSKKLWSTVKNLTNKPSQPNNQGISFNNKIYNNPKKLANKFNKQFTPTSNKKPTQHTRNILRNLKKKPTDPEINITPEQTAKAIRSAKNSKALGPDGISPLMLKHLGPNAIKYLTKLYNRVVNTATTPAVWKQSRIIALLKPGKPTDQGSSHRPISLLSPPAKILESILLPEITEAINLPRHQHGFRKCHSTATALHEISTHITDGLNKKQPVDRTVAVAIDLSKAFDTVDHDLLMEDIHNLQLNGNIKRFLCSYIRGRQTYVEFRGSKSTFRKMRQGVPQGGVLSPLLFNLYMAKMPQPPGNIKLSGYADDNTILNSGKHYKPLCDEINLYLNILDDWFKSRNLMISPSKSTATIFTTDTNDINIDLPIHIKNNKVPTVKKPKILGVTFDNLFNFRQHATEIKSKVQSRNNILKALSGTTWGKEKEILLTTYKATSQSILNYCSPIWTPNLCNTAWNDLQTTQNGALRTITGCIKMTSSDHLHAECKIMPVKDHCTMLSKQFHLATRQEHHPNKRPLKTRPPRKMKKTLDTEFGDEISNIISAVGFDNNIYKKKLKQIHTESVRTAIANQSNNRILNEPAPSINKEELTLPRSARTSLARLRSGFSPTLNSYTARIRNDPTLDVCPICNQQNHTTQHLFNCPQNPTHLTTRDLWSKPVEAAQFLGLLDGQENDDNG